MAGNFGSGTMGKKSREKQLRREGIYQGNEDKGRQTGEPLLKHIIFWLASLSLFFPLFLDSHFYFPFVGPKALIFMGFGQIIFFLWLFLILKHPEYRPKKNAVLTAVLIFMAVMILSTIFSVDPSRSFWSKFERMTGLMQWLHFFAFFLVISSVFKKKEDWQRFLLASIIFALIVAGLGLLEEFGVKAVKFADRKGATLGNTSFLGTYLLFNIFFSAWLFCQTRKKEMKIFYGLAGLLMFAAVYLEEARAATISIIGGFSLIFLFWLAFKAKERKARILGRLGLVLGTLALMAICALVFIPGNPIRDGFIKTTTFARLVNWDIAWKVFLERPLLGWGPETYTITFTKHFDPCLFIGQCGGEIWFDRSHNIIFDTLATTGVLGLVSFLGLIFSAIFVFARTYFKRDGVKQGFLVFSIFSALLIAYFVQDLTVFDMPTSIAPLMIVLGFAVFSANSTNKNKGDKTDGKPIFGSAKTVLSGLIIIVFILCFLKFNIGPWKTGYYTIKSVSASTFQKRIIYGQKALESSPVAKYQIRDFFTERAQTVIRAGLEEIGSDQEKIKWAAEEIKFSIQNLEKSVKESPIDFRSFSQLASLLNLYNIFNQESAKLAEEYGRAALELSPKNEQAYWNLAQTKTIQRQFDEALALVNQSIELEPRLLTSYVLGINIAEVAGKKDEAKQFAEQAMQAEIEWQDFNPSWKTRIEEILALNADD